MALPRFFSISSLSIAGVVLLVGGLGVAIFASQQQQDNRSKAAAQASWPKTFVAAKNVTGPTLTGFVVGAKYKIIAEGVADYDSDATHIKVDPMWGGSTSNPGCYCQRYSEPKLNGKGWTAEDVGTKYQSDHSYYDYWIADKTSLQFGVADSNYADNTGGWYVTITLVSLPEAANKPPTANAGADQTITLPTNSVSLTGSGTDSDGTIASYSWTQTSGPSGSVITHSGSAATTVTDLVEGVYKFTLKVTDNKGATATDEVQVTVNKGQAPPPSATTLSFDLLFHGIGKGGDNRNPDGGGNPNPLHPTRSVIVDVYDLDDQPVITNKEGQVTYDSASGSYKGNVAVGSAVTSGAYQIKVKLSQSLRASTSRNIVAGTTNTIPQMKLVNGDTNNDAKLDIADYNLIQGCYSDFDLPPADCDATRKAQADIDDDDKVNQFDLNLFLREMSVQQL